MIQARDAEAPWTPIYDVVLVRKDGKQMRAGWGIRDKQEAEWLAATMRGALRD